MGRSDTINSMTATKAAIVLVLIVAAIARCWSIGRESYWIDELYTLETSAGNGLAHEWIPAGRWLDPPVASTADLSGGGGIRGIIHHAPQDTQAPIYFMVLNIWRHAFGSSEAAVRALSALCSLAALIAIGVMMRMLQVRNHKDLKTSLAPSPSTLGEGWGEGLRVSEATQGPLPCPPPDYRGRESATSLSLREPPRLAPAQPAIFAMVLAAVSGTQIVFAQEARPYVMALLFVLLAAIALLSIERRGLSLARGIGLAAALMALMLTHYTGLAPAGALLVYALVRLRGRDRLRTIGAFMLAGCGFALLWGSILLQQRREALDRLVFLNDPAPGHMLRTLDRALCQPLSMLIAAQNVSSQPPAWRWVARALGLTLFFAPALLIRRQRALLLPWLLLIFPIAQSALADLFWTRAALELPRFSFLSSAGAITTLAVLIASLLPRRTAVIVAWAIVGFMLLLLIAPAPLGRPSAYERGKPDIRLLARELRRNAHPGEPLILARPRREPWQAGTLWCGITQVIGPWPGPLLVLDAPPGAQVLARLRSLHGAWLLSPTPNLPIDELLPGFTFDNESIVQVKNLGTAAQIVAATPASPRSRAEGDAGVAATEPAR
jgi:hypothetical protein